MTFQPALLALPSRLSRALATALVAACATACTIDKNLATIGDTADDSTSTTDAAPTTDTTTTDATTTDATTTDATTTDETTIDPTTVAPGDSDSSTTEPVEPDPACACISLDGLGQYAYSCPKRGCETVNAGCDFEADTDGDTDGGGACEFGGTFAVDAEALDCVLDQLISGQVGYIEYRFTPDQGFSEAGGFIGVVPEREGLMRTWEWMDLSGEWSSAGVVPLKDAAYFEGCKAELDLEARFWCMTAWSTQAPQAQCDGPGEGDDL